MVRRAALAFVLVACSAPPPLKAAAPVERPVSDAADPLEAVARGLVENGCERAASAAGLGDTPRVPTLRGAAGAKSPYDVVVYTAHPDDEAMYAGGTMDRLVRAGHRVAFVMMSHGEGGRLLERNREGGVEERRDYPRSHVVEVRDEEVAEAARRVGVEHAHLHPAEANADDAWTTSCSETMSRWNASLPGGVAGVLSRLVADIRTRRPKVIITLDPRDDPQSSHHGHHKAVGVLADAAARLAGDPNVRTGGEPHVVEELLTMAPQGTHADVVVPVDKAARLSMLSAYASQFVPEKLAVDPVAQRPNEDFILRWRAVNAPPVQSSRLTEWASGAPAVP